MAYFVELMTDQKMSRWQRPPSVHSEMSLDLHSSSQINGLNTDATTSPMPSTQEETPNAKMSITDVFKVMKPIRLRKMDDMQATREDYVEVIQSDPIDVDDEVMEDTKKKTAVNLIEVLNGNRKAKPDNEGTGIMVGNDDKYGVVQVTGKAKSGITAKDLLTGTRNPEIVEVLSSDEEGGAQEKHTEKHGSLIVNFKYTTREKKMQALERKIRQSANRSVSAKDFLMSFGRPKKECKAESVAIDNERQEMGNNLRQRKNSVSKLKELEPPIITRDMMHVKYDEPQISYRTISLPQRISQRTLQTNTVNYKQIDTCKTEHNLNKFRYTLSEENKIALALERVPELKSDSRFKKFEKLLTCKPESDLWTSMFHPMSDDEILWDGDETQTISQCLNNSFSMLKRNTKRHNFKKSKRNTDEMDNFIVYDDGEDTETDDQTYTPLIILSGPRGVGKTSAVYAMANCRSGYVHEINASQSRGRKDILANLKEMSTTQLVHSSSNDDVFQKGFILFDDVDVLLESDKGFWLVVEDVLKVSRKPIILTCTDVKEIPESILECANVESSFYQIKRQPSQLLCHYLYLCALVNDCDVDHAVLMELVKDNNHDLRKCLFELEMLCQIPTSKFGVTKILFNETVTTEENGIDVLNLTKQLEIKSLCDEIGTSSKSMIPVDEVEDEQLSLVPILLSENLHPPLLLSEYDISKELYNSLTKAAGTSEHEGAAEQPSAIRQRERAFALSKIKNLKRLTRGTARQVLGNPGAYFADERSDFSLFETLNPVAYFTDVSPIIREFARFEQSAAKGNNLIIENDIEHRPAKILMQQGLLQPKRFNADYSAVLYSTEKSSGYWD